MLARQLKINNFLCYQGAIKIKDISEKETQKNTPDIREFKKMQYKSVDPKEVEHIKSFILNSIYHDKEHFIGTLTFGIPTFAEKITFRNLSIEEDHYQVGGVTDAKFGILHIEQYPWLPIDGLHRYYSIIQVLSELPQNKKEIFEREEVPVIIIPFDSFDQLEDLMLRQQKSVRSVDRGETIRVANDDIYALLARKLCSIDGTKEGVIPEQLVNWKTNTLTNRLQKFTTLSVLYDSAKILYPDINHPSFSKDLLKYYEKFSNIWKQLIENFSPFKEAIIPNANIAELRNKYICLKPTGQLVIIHIIELATKSEGQEAITKTIGGLNRVVWGTKNPLWDNVLLTNGRLNSTDAAIDFASNIIAYHIGIPLSDKEILKLKNTYQRTKKGELPTPLYTHIPF